ncbi:glycosyltransferase family 4 protein [Brachybacterium vulturis]|uniref:glycosyltransferase family 4 protein n=1 Tax=Brachybacterium vulturis TaxID=2017484 RepID=UPI0037356B55
MPSLRHVARNARLLLDSATQHLVDDPALLVVQVSRRLPLRVRLGVGKALLRVGAAVPRTRGFAALGAHMAGDATEAQALAAGPAASGSRIGGEVAVLLGRFDLLSSRAAAATRARASWMRGDLSEALEILAEAGRGESIYAQRLRSELRLLEPGRRVSVTQPATSRIPPPLRDRERLRVLHVLTNSLPHTQSGYSLRSHRILTALGGAGIESVALTRTAYPVMLGKPFAAAEDVVDGVRYVRTLPRRLPSTQEGRLQVEVERALELVAEFRPHVIHATTNYFNALVAQAVSAATGVPWILEVRGLMEKTWIASHPGEEEQRRAAASEKARAVALREAELASAAGAVITLSDTMVAELSRRGLEADTITVVPNGVDDSLLSDHLTVADARAAVGLEAQRGAFLIGAVSALIDYEGFDTLLRAAAMLLEDPRTETVLREGLRVALAGDGTAAPGLRALAAELGIADRVIMPGRVPREAARNWVQALDVVVVPRHDLDVARTVTPQKPVEAMALARPVIVSDLPALRETVTDDAGKCVGALVPAGDPAALAAQIHALWTDTAERTRRSSEGHELAAERTWAALVRRYDAIYAQMASDPRGGAARGE